MTMGGYMHSSWLTWPRCTPLALWLEFAGARPAYPLTNSCDATKMPKRKADRSIVEEVQLYVNEQQKAVAAAEAKQRQLQEDKDEACKAFEDRREELEAVVARLKADILRLQA